MDDNEFWDIVYNDHYEMISEKYSHLLYDQKITTEEYLDIIEREVGRIMKMEKLKKLISNIENDEL